MPDRIISLVDCNAFYAACEILRQPALAQRPLLVAGDPRKRHGIVLTASYAARRASGGQVHSGMPLWQALRLLPRDTVVLPPDHEWYADVSQRVMAVLARFSPVVEVASIDEAWSDWTGCEHLFGGDARTMAQRVKDAIRQEIGISVSAGVAWSRMTAKMAAELEKPDGLTVLTRADWIVRVYPLPVSELYGVGPRTAPKLMQVGIQTVGDLAQADPDLLRNLLGSTGLTLQAAARGADTDPVMPRHQADAQSIGHSLTLPRDTVDTSEIHAVLLTLADQVGARLRRHGFVGRTVTLQIRDAAFKTITRSRTLPQATAATDQIYQTALALLADNWQPSKPVRLLGIQVSRLERTAEAPPAAPAARRTQRRDAAVDAIRARFGSGAIMRAAQLDSPLARGLLDQRRHGSSFQRDRLPDPGSTPN